MASLKRFDVVLLSTSSTAPQPSDLLKLRSINTPLPETLNLRICNSHSATKSQNRRASKVHGSLARAGKVRGQTPKVAKQDKKKKPRGRAHKRMQYNRRFVTAVVGFGKKRGPNSSEK
ncbi:hypothetical protein Dsin_014080 [Dipteronia sinensis]|uniref:40S ribosomal protein S30 n=1 Tax=Dipteronia sinensis TaxID=43782 RepID=A0AAE0AM56_9ROSI|nr:hypothetical protein Dsin_014080 [Dipteronia sinensis]